MSSLIIRTTGRILFVDPRLRRWAADQGVRVRHILLDLARNADRATALVTAKRIEYPTAHLALTGPAWPWRPTTLLGVALLLSVSLGLLAGRFLRPSGRPGSSHPGPDMLVDATTASGREP